MSYYMYHKTPENTFKSWFGNGNSLMEIEKIIHLGTSAWVSILFVQFQDSFVLTLITKTCFIHISAASFQLHTEASFSFSAGYISRTQLYLKSVNDSSESSQVLSFFTDDKQLSVFSSHTIIFTYLNLAKCLCKRK